MPRYDASTTLPTDGLSTLTSVNAAVEEMGWAIEGVGPGTVHVRVIHRQRVLSGRLAVHISPTPDGCTVDVEGKNSGGGPLRKRELERWVRRFVETLERLADGR